MIYRYFVCAAIVMFHVSKRKIVNPSSLQSLLHIKNPWGSLSLSLSFSSPPNYISRSQFRKWKPLNFKLKCVYLYLETSWRPETWNKSKFNIHLSTVKINIIEIMVWISHFKWSKTDCIKSVAFNSSVFGVFNALLFTDILPSFIFGICDINIIAICFF